MTIQFEITHNISSSKGWGRYRASTPTTKLVASATGNEWVSAPHSGTVEEGTPITVTLQTMQRSGKMRKETINTVDYALVSAPGATVTLGFWNGLEVSVAGARKEKDA